MGSVVVAVLTVGLGLIFMFLGTLVLCPVVNADLYHELQKGFIEYAKVFPFHELTGFKPDGNTYRIVVGSIEFVCGMILAGVSGTLRELANVILLVLMGGAIYTHWVVGETLEKTVPALVLGFLLACRFLLAGSGGQDSEAASHKKKQ